MSSNVTISDGTTTVTLHTTIVKESYTNQVESFNLPRAEANYTQGWKMNLMNLLMVKRSFDITGLLNTEQGTAAATALANLRSISTNGKLLTVTYLSEAITGFIVALDIVEVPSTNATSVREVAVKVMFIAGDRV